MHDARHPRPPRLVVAALWGAAALLTAGTAAADSVCVGIDGTPFSLPGDEQAVVGTLEARSCYAVQERSGGRTRIWVSHPQGFQGEAEISDRALAYILVDDVEMRLEPPDEVHGVALSGGVVLIEKELGADQVMARLLEGRVAARFLASTGDLYHAESWPTPDPDDEPDAGWPTATLPLPPEPVALTKIAGGYNIRAKIGRPLFDVTEVLMDPARGQLRMEFLEQAEHEAKVRVVGPTAWVEGWVTDLDWRGGPPEGGWDPTDGMPSPKSRAVGTRQVGPKGAELSLQAKGDAFGKLPAGSWVSVTTDEGSWLEISAVWEGGSVAGWVEKRLLSEKKQGTPPTPKVSRLTSVTVGKVAVRWLEEEGREEDDVPQLTEAQVRAIAVGQVPRIRRLYAAELTHDPALDGELTARLVVGSTGLVNDQSFAVETLSSADLKEALEEQLGQLEFGEPEEPRKAGKLDPNMVVWIQFLFAPLGS